MFTNTVVSENLISTKRMSNVTHISTRNGAALAIMNRSNRSIVENDSGVHHSSAVSSSSMWHRHRRGGALPPTRFRVASPTSPPPDSRAFFCSLHSIFRVIILRRGQLLASAGTERLQLVCLRQQITTATTETVITEIESFLCPAQFIANIIQ